MSDIKLGNLIGEEPANMEPALWEHLKVVGIDVPADQRPEHFRCAC